MPALFLQRSILENQDRGEKKTDDVTHWRKSKVKVGRRDNKNLKLQKAGRKVNREEKTQHNLSRNIIPVRVDKPTYLELFRNGATSKKRLPKAVNFCGGSATLTLPVRRWVVY